MAAKTTAGVDAARRLRQLRERVGVPKERVALAFGMSAENWRHYESGRNQLAATMLPTLAELYGMTLAELVAELLEGEPGHSLAHAGQDLHNGSTANYNYTESRRGLSQAAAPTRQLVAAGR